MLQDIHYLWANRERSDNLKRSVVLWIKRAILAGPLVRILGRIEIARSRGARIGVRVVLGRSRLDGNLKNLCVGNGTSLGRCHVGLHDKVFIGENVVINDGAQLLTGSHDILDSNWCLKTAPIFIGDFAWIATGAIICPGVTIGVGAVVGAGSVVRRSVPDYAVVSGNPAEPVAKRCRSLNYVPALLNAPLEAWIGHRSACG